MITEEEKMRCRHHLGYPNFASQSTFFLGFPAAIQTQFLIEGAFSKILPVAEWKFRELLGRLDALECQIVDNTENVEAEQVGSIKLREKAFEKVVQRYKWWQGELANMLGVLPNPFDFRGPMGMGYNGGNGINVPVRH